MLRRRRSRVPAEPLPDIPDAGDERGDPVAIVDATADAAVGLDDAAEQAGPERDADVEDSNPEAFEPEDFEPEAEIGDELEDVVDDGDPVRAEHRRLRRRMGKSRSGFRGVFRRRGRIDDETWDSLEETLLLADVGLDVTGRILEGLRARASSARVVDNEQLPALLAEELVAQLQRESDVDRSLQFANDGITVWLVVGVNGAGKTTSVAKLAHRELEAGHRVLLAAADTFRAAATEQLESWANRLGVDCVRGQEGGDPGAVVFDAMSAAASRGAGLVVVDTAGRLHTKVNLMAELEKIRRVIDRGPATTTPCTLTEVLLVLDATVGQNGLAQARQFTEAVGVTGVVLAKLDGTAKGGIVLAVEDELGVPVKMVGIGERLEDLIPFDPRAFADALVGTE